MDQPLENHDDDEEEIPHSPFLERDSPVQKDRRNLPH